jgi:putative spermidine/putrescine transport system ATP-binding protein
MTVGENIEYGMRVKRVPRPEREERRRQALEMVRLTGLDSRKPSELSGGQRQRVALARSIVNRPKVLLLDEPLGALDLKLREQMQVELKSIQGEVGITFVYVTHDQEEALTMSDRIAVFNDGRVEQVGTPAEVYERPGNDFVAGFVGVSNTLERDGRRFTVRPEKIRILASGDDQAGMTVERGRVTQVAYAGMITRYLITLDAGGDLQVVRQNLETSSAEAQAERGREVTLGWRPEHTVAVEPEMETKGEAS